MKKRNGLKRTLALAVISVLVALSMFVGTTFAWFTDSVTSSGNIIASGKLDVTMEYKNNLSDKEWTDASTTAIFNYDNWEPGYTEVKYVKVANVGTLDFDYQITIYPNITPTAGEVNLSDVIDVYVLKGATANFTSFADVQTNAVAMGSMTDMMGKVLVNGSLYDEDYANASEEIIAIVLHMQETAGNEYMGLSAGDGFTVQLLAKQKVSESDSFGPNYDEGAEYDPLQARPVASVVKRTDLIGVTITSPHDDVTAFAPIDPLGSFQLETAYTFTAPVLPDGVNAERTPYAEWKADFEVSVDRNVTAGQIGLAGEYAKFGSLEIGWVGFLSPIDVPADTPVRLIEPFFPVTYKDLVDEIKVFTCGAWIKDEALRGATMTVELKLYEVDENGNETGNSIVIGSYSYTF